MAMTPDEIRAKSFPSVKKGGVDADVVSAYLEKVAQEMQRLQIDLEATQREMPETEAAAPAPAEPAKRTIAVVGSHVDEVLEAAQRSADAIVRDAEDWASTHKAEADAYVRQVRNQVDELRRTTEHQAESFRSETVAYANRIREDAETAAAELRARAEQDAASQYDRLTQDATERWESVKSAERELLSRINITSSDLERARDHFQQAVANHSDPTIEPGDLALAEPVGDALAPPAEMPEPRLPELTDVEDDTDDGSTDDDESVAVEDLFDTAGDEPDTDDAPADPWGSDDTDLGDDTDEDDADDSDVEAEVDDEVEAELDSDDEVEADIEAVDVSEMPPPPPPPAATTDDTGSWESDDAWSDADSDDADTDEVPTSWGSDDETETTTSWESGEPTDAWAADEASTDTDAEPDNWGSTDEASESWAADEDESTTGEGWEVPETTSAWGSDDDTTTSWESDDDEAPAATTASWGAEEETTTSWGSGDETDDQSWGSGDDSWSSGESGWSPSATTDPWAAEPSDGSAGSLVTSAEVDQAEEGSSFFDKTDDPETDADMGDDPLAAMVREAVERVTDGEGAN